MSRIGSAPVKLVNSLHKKQAEYDEMDGWDAMEHLTVMD